MKSLKELVSKKKSTHTVLGFDEEKGMLDVRDNARKQTFKWRISEFNRKLESGDVTNMGDEGWDFDYFPPEVQYNFTSVS